MKQKPIKLNAHLLEFLNGLDNKERISYISQAPQSLIKFIADLFHNILSGNFELSSEILIKLKPHRKVIEAVCKKGIPLSKRRKIIKKKNFFTDIIRPIIPDLFQKL